MLQSWGVQDIPKLKAWLYQCPREGCPNIQSLGLEEDVLRVKLVGFIVNPNRRYLNRDSRHKYIAVLQCNDCGSRFWLHVNYGWIRKAKQRGLWLQEQP